MHISAELKAIAVLSTMLVPALGAVTAGQITTELQDMNKAVQNIINEASSLPAAVSHAHSRLPCSGSLAVSDVHLTDPRRRSQLHYNKP